MEETKQRATTVMLSDVIEQDVMRRQSQAIPRHAERLCDRDTAPEGLASRLSVNGAGPASTLPRGALVGLQRSAGNRAVASLLYERRASHSRSTATLFRSVDDDIAAALAKPDPVAGVGDFPAAFRILNGLSIYALLNVLSRFRRTGEFTTLSANFGQATGVNVARLQVAFRAVERKGAVTAGAFAIEEQTNLSQLPDDQKADIAQFLNPNWLPPLVPGELATVVDAQLGVEYERGIKGDASRLQAAEEEIAKREEQRHGFGTGVPGGEPAAGTPGVTQVTPSVAIQMLKNVSKGEPSFRPELGKGGCSWFVTSGTPYVGIDPAKNVSIEVEISRLDQAITLGEQDLVDIHAKEMDATKVEAEVAFRDHYKLKPDTPLNSRMRKSLERFRDRFAESRMWDRVGERVAKSPAKVGRVVLKNSRFSKQGDGEFAVVADAKQIRVKGGPTRLVEALQGAGTKVEPVVEEAAVALAKRMAQAGKVRAVFRYGGRVLIVVAIAVDVYNVIQAEDHAKAVIESAGGWAGATAGGAAFSAMWTPADVAGPWAWAGHGVGVLVSGAIGYWVGSEITRTVYELVAVES